MIQRVSAIYIAFYVIYLGIVFMIDNPLNANDWAHWVAIPYNNVATGLFLIAVLWHAWIGVRDIVLDYIPDVAARLLALTLVGGIIIGSGLWGMKALFMVTTQ
ncbi:Succinate dehydrogenase hydrophobic membrane anchor protein [hydrothermal vent metagenome]|uniref:Succinate dehydrogenase hydrophobic membrane anchor protein n=1 Tax=hydrothermal vent metagenome TaxID=652676 RepID=A0A3B0X461_9ZZZZ